MAVTFHGSRPLNPQIGDVFIDSAYITWLWTGCGWDSLSSESIAEEPKFTPPTKEQLEKHPSLKTAWEEFLVVKKLLGV